MITDFGAVTSAGAYKTALSVAVVDGWASIPNLSWQVTKGTSPMQDVPRRVVYPSWLGLLGLGGIALAILGLVTAGIGLGRELGWTVGLGFAIMTWVGWSADRYKRA